MARHLLDTNVVSYLVDTASPFHGAARGRLAALDDADEVALSVLSLYELRHWLAFEHAPRGAADRLVGAFTILPLPPSGAELFGALMRDLGGSLPRADLRRHKIDCMIAVTALEHGAVLVSNDALFARLATLVPALRVADWTA